MKKEKNSHKFYRTIYKEEKERFGLENIDKAMQLLADYYHYRLKRPKLTKAERLRAKCILPG